MTKAKTKKQPTKQNPKAPSLKGKGKSRAGVKTGRFKKYKEAMRREYIEGYYDEETDTYVLPTINDLARKYDIWHTIILPYKKEWDKQRDEFQSDLEARRQEQRKNALLKASEVIDDRAVLISQLVLSQIAATFDANRANMTKKDNPFDGISADDKQKLTKAALNAQQIGKLALGDMSLMKGASLVTVPPEFIAILRAMEEHAQTASSGDTALLTVDSESETQTDSS